MFLKSVSKNIKKYEENLHVHFYSCKLSNDGPSGGAKNLAIVAYAV